ncbi:MAG: helicase-associated domain-containing protein, partial [Chloroflexota bacterium]|nr:helicase-associated domain-containing protein [Chloroflexota bacterium]
MTNTSLIFQRNGTLLVTPGSGLERVLQLVRQCGQLRAIVAGNYVYDLSPVAMWGAAGRGMRASELLDALDRSAAMPVPAAIAATIAENMGRFGAVEIVEGNAGLELVARSVSVLTDIGYGPPSDGTAIVRLDRRDIA